MRTGCTRSNCIYSFIVPKSLSKPFFFLLRTTACMNIEKKNEDSNDRYVPFTFVIGLQNTRRKKIL